ncbi:hypothetical protein [Pseudomonas xionganensis]|uniref:Uncharacterized protein n=1 Tax=Pseudomonas xionganensis TaxID=2654845 RepID=A0A6I4KS54_9PSED|nr:hypothetical protein [Pseudomonas xionganensis]MVW75360.1 hypothetical protein [Pseudomonas xionganensis]
MQSQPTYSSHQHQQELRGRAIDLDPAKHPRRAAKAMARERFEKEARWLERETSPEGIARNQQQLAQVRQALAEKREQQLRELAASGMSIISMASALKLSRRRVMLMLADLKIERGPKMQMEA